MHYEGRENVLRRVVETYVDMPFICCTEEEIYACLLTLIVRNGSGLTDAAPTTHSLEYVAFSGPYDSFYRLTNLDYWWEKIQFEQRYRVRYLTALFVNQHCVDFFAIPTRDREKLLDRLPSKWSDYEVSRLLLAPAPMVFAHRSTLAFLTERRSLLFLIAVARYGVSLCCRFSRPHLLVVQLRTSLSLRVSQLLRNWVFRFGYRHLCTHLWLMSDNFPYCKGPDFI